MKPYVGLLLVGLFVTILLIGRETLHCHAPLGAHFISISYKYEIVIYPLFLLGEEEEVVAGEEGNLKIMC